MNKYALLVGINKYQNGNNLQGCVNDVMDIRERLIGRYGFLPDNIRLLTDERATKKAQLEHLEWLIGCCSPTEQDCLAHYNSSHGTKFRIRHGNNLDNYETACLCPYDMDWDDPLSADVLHSYYRQIPPNTSLTFVADCCNSRNLVRGAGGPGQSRIKRMTPPADILARSLGQTLSIVQISDYISVIDSVHTLFLSGCQSEETSADAYIDGRFNGALTAGLKSVIDLTPEFTWESAHGLILQFLIDNKFEQHPELKGSIHALTSKLFEGLR